MWVFFGTVILRLMVHVCIVHETETERDDVGVYSVVCTLYLVVVIVCACVCLCVCVGGSGGADGSKSISKGLHFSELDFHLLT